MDEGNDFLELLELQGTLEFVSKTELLDEVRKRSNRGLSERQLTSYVSEGLVPKLARIGTRGSAYPKIVLKLLLFITAMREMGLTVQAVKELLPVWRYLQRAHRDRILNLAELEYIARQHITLDE